MTSVYVIAAEGGPVKIGIAANPQSRLAALRMGTPFPLRLAHVEDPGDLEAAKIEKAAHALFAAARTHGEWFRVTVDEARQAVQDAMERLRHPPVPAALIAPSQCRAARALLDWTQTQLATATGLSAVTIRAFEGGRDARDSNRTLLQLALEKAGVEFIPENGGGAGVRLKKSDVGTEER